MMPTVPALAFAGNEPANGTGCAIAAGPMPRKASMTRSNGRVGDTFINLSLSRGQSGEAIRRLGVTQIGALSIP